MMRAMSTGPLPRQADARKLAASGAVYEGSVKVAELGRLAQALAADGGSVDFRLQFAVTEEGTLKLDGHIDTRVTVLCQRCLEPMEIPLVSDFSLGVVHSDEKAKHLPSHLEPLVVEEDCVDTQVVLEDEVLLCLPIVSYHAEADCKRKAGYQSADEAVVAPVEPERNNPFDVLAQLKKPET